MEGIEIVRIDQGGAGEYHAQVPGTTHVGRLTWVAHQTVDGGTVHVVDHTQVPRELERRGIAGQLVAALVADAKEQGFKIDPVCSYVAAQFQRHPEWAELRA